ncbi:hypothetical protein [Cohnella sp. CFH 77786]|uniref:hypothetical protein n=1 Tax=Cohnella sp. CFH 77786 TaxID=2662265 RepID=UPI001C6101F4|nr:hypothetical protein [Cohnella sp. CFH 77786]
MTNAAAIGYAILAAKKLGLSREELHKLESIMYRIMDEVSEEEAEEAYRSN